MQVLLQKPEVNLLLYPVEPEAKLEILEPEEEEDAEDHVAKLEEEIMLEPEEEENAEDHIANLEEEIMLAPEEDAEEHIAKLEEEFMLTPE